jgi:uncharacterized protein (TIGR01244 family)
MSSLSLQQVTPTFSVAGQLTPAEMEWVAKAGFKSVIANRPEFEGGSTQPTNAALQQAAEAVGLSYVVFPIEPAMLNSKDVVGFSSLLDELPVPVLAFCRTGNRSRAIYTAAVALKENFFGQPDST